MITPLHSSLSDRERLSIKSKKQRKEEKKEKEIYFSQFWRMFKIRAPAGLVICFQGHTLKAVTSHGKRDGKTKRARLSAFFNLEPFLKNY